MKKDNTQYTSGRIKNLVETVVLAIKQYPEMLEDTEKLHALLKEKLEGYGKVEHCFNCKRSMKVTGYVADLLDALLILAMSRVVRDNLRQGMSFTEANRVHIPSLLTTHAIIKRSTKCDYLGFIKQPEKLERTGYWVLTSWAFALLRGEKVHGQANYWEGNLVSREGSTTLAGMFSTHTELVQKAISRRKKVRSDYRAEFADYNPSDWAVTVGFIE